MPSDSKLKKKNGKTEASLTTLLKEKRVFKPPAKFSAAAHVKSLKDYERIYKSSIRDPEAFWAKEALKNLEWFKPWRRVLSWKPPVAQWFVGGKINVAHNCIDRHVASGKRNKVAIRWEGEPGDTRTLTYFDLQREVSLFANALLAHGVKSGDVVAIYMPLVPELPIAMLACARIGATHTVVFGGFSSAALKDRILDSGARTVVTADGGFRKGAGVPLKDSVDEALKDTPQVKTCFVVRRTGTPVSMTPDRDVWWADAVRGVSAQCPPAVLDSEHPLFILYTSGTTGKPKGLVHTSAGYLLGATLTSKLVFDLTENDTYWCTADCGWITGHSYVVYGPLSLGATVVMYEGAPTYPEPDRFWSLIEKYGVTVFYTAPTAIRAFIRTGEEWPARHNLSSLRVLGSVGEPINPEAWMWYHRVIGGGRCPVVDTWWQTETGCIMIAPLPGATPLKPGSASLPLFGIDAQVVTRDGKPAETGFLVIKKPWPAMARSIHGDPDRYRKVYWGEIDGLYFTGDGARKDKDGYYWIMGRVDDTLNVSGHRLGTMEIESALVQHPDVAEAAVVGRPDELKGQGIVAFVTLRMGIAPDRTRQETLREFVSKTIGAIARPDEIRFTDSLPKTRSGKIMRRLLRELATTGSVSGDTSTLEDFSVLERLRASDDEG